MSDGTGSGWTPSGPPGHRGPYDPSAPVWGQDNMPVGGYEQMHGEQAWWLSPEGQAISAAQIQHFQAGQAQRMPGSIPGLTPQDYAEMDERVRAATKKARADMQKVRQARERQAREDEVRRQEAFRLEQQRIQEDLRKQQIAAQRQQDAAQCYVDWVVTKNSPVVVMRVLKPFCSGSLLAVDVAIEASRIYHEGEYPRPSREQPRQYTPKEEATAQSQIDKILAASDVVSVGDLLKLFCARDGKLMPRIAEATYDALEASREEDRVANLEARMEALRQRKLLRRTVWTRRRRFWHWMSGL